ncbi:protein MAIN-LIKE [Trifolium repens]|nr:protein MAIN-LIKE [Trifolium repens]
MRKSIRKLHKHYVFTHMPRTRGRTGRHTGREDYLQRQAEEEQQPVEPVGWPGGPTDTSLLTRYGDHIARHIWFGEERHGGKIELKLASLGKKLLGWVAEIELPQPVQRWLDISGSSPLQRTSLKMTGPNLISAFVERWHPETSSFHMPFGEMTITLDDVACLLHIPIRGEFYTLRSLTEDEAAALGAELFGVNIQYAASETRKQRGGYFSQQWLFDIFKMQCMCWIHEYFPGLGMRVESGNNCDDPQVRFPRAMRWTYKQGKMKLPENRPIMDSLTPDDVIWRPFENHRGIVPFDLISMYSGYLRGCTVLPHLPERCLRQFEYLQYIPPPPPPAPATAEIDIAWIGYDSVVDQILQPTRLVRYATETTDDHLSWYYRVSHPRVCRPIDGPHGAPVVPQYAPAQPYHHDPMAQDAPPIHHDPIACDRRNFEIAGALERYVSTIDVGRDEEEFVDLFWASSLRLFQLTYFASSNICNNCCISVLGPLFSFC